MRKTIATAALLLALSCPAWAGIVHIPPAPAPPPQPATAVQEPTTTDEDTTGATDILTQFALDLASIALPLL